MLNKQELLKRFKEIVEKQEKSVLGGDFDDDHILADNLLLEYINDEDIKNAFESIERWYS